LLLVFTLINSKSQIDYEEEKPLVVQEEIEINEYGFPDKSFSVYQNNVKRNETLSGIFSKINISPNLIEQLLHGSEKLFKSHKIVSGNNYYIYTSDDSLNSPSYFVYEFDPVNYIVFNIDEDSIDVYTGQKEVRIEQKSLVSDIYNSLYHAMLRNEASPELVIKLSEVFAWQIDFYRIQKGDSFKVIYEEAFVGDKSIGIKNIIGAYFNHADEDFYAIEFEQDSATQYFDQNGKSLKKAFLKAPLEYSRISSKYSLRRLHPVRKTYKAHLGTDYAAPTGTPIRSIGDGVVVEASYTGGNGRYIKVKHNSVYTTQYLHMAGFAKGIRQGVRVKQGQVIGYVGSTGLATGPHLCFRFWKNGVQVDPLKEKIPPSHPVKGEYLEAYNKRREEVIMELNNLNIMPENQPGLTTF
jgi:murein DD-endopeptidase MepM/ murein hydrolase activator NlpD